MSRFQFFCEPIKDFSPSAGTFLFNNPAHLKTQCARDWWRYGLSSSGKTCIQIYIHVQDEIASSPLRAPFGSVEVFKNISLKEWKNFFIKLTQDLKLKAVEKLHITNFPSQYNLKVSGQLLKVLIDLGFSCQENSSSIIEVNSILLEKKMVPAKRQKLKKCIAQLTFRQESISKLKMIYHFLENCRHEKGQLLSMTLEALQKIVKAFPADYLLFSAYHNKNLAAAAIVIKISKKVVYTFYYGHAKEFNKISPVVFLINGIYRYSVENNFKMIDLGTSMLDKKVNKPLLHFKASIGGQPTSKYDFVRYL